MRRQLKLDMELMLALLALLLALLFFLFYSPLRQRFGFSSLAQSSEICDATLWEHVYHGPDFATGGDRLSVITSCVTVTGVFMRYHREADGDWHIQLKPDSEFRYMLNARNVKAQNSALVVEPMCAHAVTQRDTLDEGVCVDWNQNTLFTRALIGKHVSVTGAYVTDMHHGWNEIHPVSAISKIP